MLALYLFVGIIGFALGIYVCKKFFSKKEDINTDDCLQHLKEKGYYTKLCVPTKEIEK